MSSTDVHLAVLRYNPIKSILRSEFNALNNIVT